MTTIDVGHLESPIRQTVASKRASNNMMDGKHPVVFGSENSLDELESP